MRKAERFFWVFLFFVFSIGASSIAEEITLTTYYPSPQGAYEDLSAKDGFVVGENYAGTDKDQDTSDYFQRERRFYRDMINDNFECEMLFLFQGKCGSYTGKIYK